MEEPKVFYFCVIVWSVSIVAKVRKKDHFRKTLEAAAKYRDVVKESEIGINRIILAIENQSEIHYAMPLRTMVFDALSYDQQYQLTKKQHRKNQDLHGAEFLSGFSKEDKLQPITTMVLYLGEKPWDGPRTLHEMLDISNLPSAVKKRIPDYPLLLVEARRLKNLDQFQTDIGIVFGFLQHSQNKTELKNFVEEHSDEFSQIDEDAFYVISELTNTMKMDTIIENVVDEGGTVNMCKAIDDMIEDGRSEGREEGRITGKAEGEYQKLISLVQKKVVKNMTPEEIADLFEEDLNIVQNIYKAIVEHPEFTTVEIYEVLLSNE